MNSQKSDIRNQIYTDLRNQIFKRELHRGDRLVETQIAASYNINKRYVHDVLMELEQQQLVRYIPMKGFLVQGISRSDLLEIAKIREMLESAIFEDFLLRAKGEDLDAVMLFTKRKIAFLQAGLKEEAHKETTATFDRIYECTVYRRMAQLLNQYRDYIDIMIRLAFDMPDDIEKTIHNSQLLYQVFENRDYGLCKEWIHIRYSNLVQKIKNSSLYED